MSKGFTTLYRLFTVEGTLLYIGISARAELRICCQHLVDKEWFREVERATFEHFDVRHLAEEAEIKAIKREAPLFNIAHNEMPWGGTQNAWDILQERLERKKFREELEHDAA